MITANPEIEAMYVSWDRPALLVIKALKELGREDVAVFTTDLDHGIASAWRKESSRDSARRDHTSREERPRQLLPSPGK